MARSWSSVIGAKMKAFIIFVICCVVGGAVGHNVKTEAPYNVGPNDLYTAVAHYLHEPSQRLFWSNQGSNQVGGTGLWATLTNKFPFLGNMFGRMELPTEYGVPSQNSISTQYGPPVRFQPQLYKNQPNYEQQNSQQFAKQYSHQFSQQYPQQYSQQYPQQFSQQYPQQYSQQYPQQVSQQYPQQSSQQYPQQFSQQYPQQYPRQYPQQFDQRLIPSSRDVGFTDDAVIVTPPQVPVAQPAPAPVPFPNPAPSPVPVPSAEPSGYTYNKPQYRLDLPHK